MMICSRPRHRLTTLLALAVCLVMTAALGAVPSLRADSRPAESEVPRLYDADALRRWLWNDKDDSETEAEIEGYLTKRLRLLGGRDEQERAWLLFEQRGSLAQKHLLIVFVLPAERGAAERSWQEIMALLEQRQNIGPIFSYDYLLVHQDAAPTVWQEKVLALGDDLSQYLLLYIDESGLKLDANAEVLLRAAAETAAELGLPVEVDIWSDREDGAAEKAYVEMTGGGRRSFDLLQRLLWRLDGQELLPEASGLSLSLGGYSWYLTAGQRLWLPWLAGAALLLSLCWLALHYRGWRRFFFSLIPLCGYLGALYWRWQSQSRLADLYLLWSLAAVLILLLPLRLRRLLACLHGLLLLRMLLPIFLAQHGPSTLQLCWALMQLLWSLLFGLRPQRP